ncbi:hypothetical protein L3V31_01285 [Vibrio sp. J1-1]|uniref:hypothetical protein n=1 Tax=Vibrio sp. J1-1 TaxID=2912251 RepID=UPI001F1EA3F5|nr:hypothetical protein [Vibrio sp. J1-1]MBR9876000.1 hypothetical protein [Vibrionaceae bacterium]MCF7480370.1 hypothetical protein [Vibrio sp. J1-1]
MSNERICTDQAESLRRLMKNPVCLDKLKVIQVELRQAIIKGQYKDADRLMVLLDKTQKELEETYWV